MLASDLNNPNFTGASNPDSVLHVKFYMRSVQNNYKSEKEGRPIYEEIPYILIMSPGNQLSVIDTPARNDHKQRFPIQWAAFQNNQSSEEQIVGTPVEQWPIISRSQADELKGLKFFTVEQVAGASDLQAQRMGMNGMVLRQKAQSWLQAAKDSALEQKQAAEIIRKDQEIAELNRKIDMLAEQMNSMSEKPRVKRKYTRRKITEMQPEA